MKPYHYIIIVLLIIILGVLIFARPTTNESPATSGTSDVTVINTTPKSTNPTPKPAATVSVKATTSTAPKTSGSYYSGPKPSVLPTYYNATDMSSSSVMLVLASPPSNSSITSPITISGQARGSWYYEAVFPVYITDSSGRILATSQARAQSNWQTSDFVAFATTFSFPRQPSGSTGFVILKKDNPSGLLANDAAVEVQVTFQ